MEVSNANAGRMLSKNDFNTLLEQDKAVGGQTNFNSQSNQFGIQ
jgi:hypothetical protein